MSSYVPGGYSSHVIIATRPDYTDHEWTADQQAHHNRFQRAAAYARVASKTNPLYAKLAQSTAKKAYNLALSDWFHAPVIHDVTRQDGRLRINVMDNIQVIRVAPFVPGSPSPCLCIRRHNGDFTTGAITSSPKNSILALLEPPPSAAINKLLQRRDGARRYGVNFTL